MPALAEARVFTPQFQQESREAEANAFGAFWQVFVKQKDSHGIPHVSCLSYPLPGGVNASQARHMLYEAAGIQLNENARSYSSKSGELQFLALPNAVFDTDMQRRFLGVPEERLGVHQGKRREELLAGVLYEFNDGLTGKRHASAQASKGKNIFAFSYNQYNGHLYGKDRKGREGKPLSELAMEGDLEHTHMLQALEKRLLAMDEGVVINFDKSKTVSLCCALFFKEKLLSGFQTISDYVRNMLSLYLGDSARYAFANQERIRCETCGKSKGACACGSTI